MNFRFIHAADLHLDSPLRGLEPGAPADRIRGATRAALVNLVDFALQERPDFVLLAGDLYDGDWRDWRTGTFLVGQLARLTRGNIPIVAIRGNHDADSVITKDLPLPGELLPATGPHTVMPIPGVAVHGQSFATKGVTENLALAYPKPLPDHFNIGLLHTACGSAEHDNYAPCTPGELAGKGYDYWALGHVHTRAELSRDPWIVFPGNLQGRHVRECGSKGASLVTVRDGRVAEVRHHAMDVLRWDVVEAALDGAATEDSLLARLRVALSAAVTGAEGRLLLARVVLTGATALHAVLSEDRHRTRALVQRAAAEVAGEDELWIESVRVETGPPAGAALRHQAGAAGTLMSALETVPPIDAELAAFVRDMANRLDPALLEPGHPLPALLRGEMPDSLVRRARALLQAELLREG